jgi:hypothetical protein
MAAVTVGDLLDGRVSLYVECLDRVCLNGYVPTLQVGGQAVSHEAASGVADPIAGDLGEDRHVVPPIGIALR